MNASKEKTPELEFTPGPLKGKDTVVELDGEKFLVKGQGYYIREKKRKSK